MSVNISPKKANLTDAQYEVQKNKYLSSADFIYRNLQIQNNVIGTGDRGYPPEIWHHRKPADSLGNSAVTSFSTLPNRTAPCVS